MRQTLALFLALGVVIGGYLHFKDKITVAPNIGTPEQFARSKAPRTQQKISKSTTKGVRHNESRTNHEHRKSKNHGEDEGTSGATSEIESLTSIYQDSQRREQQPESVVENSEVPELEADPMNIESSQKPAVIPGVKVSAWVLSQKNRLNVQVTDPKHGQGMRYFFNCMELKKKGPKSLSERDCEEVLAKREAVDHKSTY